MLDWILSSCILLLKVGGRNRRLDSEQRGNTSAQTVAAKNQTVVGVLLQCRFEHLVDTVVFGHEMRRRVVHARVDIVGAGGIGALDLHVAVGERQIDEDVLESQSPTACENDGFEVVFNGNVVHQGRRLVGDCGV